MANEKATLHTIPAAPAHNCQTSDSQGMVVIVCLWILAFMSLVAMNLALRARVQIRAISGQLGTVIARERAVSGFFTALDIIIHDQEPHSDSFAEPWAHNPEKFDHYPQYRVSYKDSEPSKPDPENVTHYGCIDETSKININKADAPSLERLLDHLDLDQTLAAYILDFRDEDDDPANNGNGAEQEYYNLRDKPYDPKNKDYTDLKELLLVKEMTKKAFETIQPYITLYGEGLVNINTAPLPVLIALGAEPALARDIVSFRNGDDGIRFSEDDRFFSDLDTMAQQLDEYAFLDTFLQKNLQNLIEKLTISSRIFSIESTGYAQSGNISKHVVAVIQRPKSPEKKGDKKDPKGKKRQEEPRKELPKKQEDKETEEPQEEKEAGPYRILSWIVY